MQSWDIGRFLQHALPQELDTLRLVGLSPMKCRDTDTRVWRTHLIPIDAPAADPPWEFMVDMLWLLEDTPSMLQFWTVASIAMPASSRPWLVREVDRRNDEGEIPLFLIEHGDGRLSLSASLFAEIGPAEVEAFKSRTPPKPFIEGFAQSYEKASEALLQAWQDGVAIGKDYRALN